MSDRHQARRDKLRRKLKKAGADALLVTNFTNVTYLTGFTGDDSFLLVRPDGQHWALDARTQGGGILEREYQQSREPYLWVSPEDLEQKGWREGNPHVYLESKRVAPRFVKALREIHATA